MRDRQTDTDTDRETGKETDRGRDRDRETENERERSVYCQMPKTDQSITARVDQRKVEWRKEVTGVSPF